MQNFANTSAKIYFKSLREFHFSYFYNEVVQNTSSNLIKPIISLYRHYNYFSAF